MATQFERIKMAVDREKQNKIKFEARLDALKEEEERIKQEASEVLGMDVTSPEQIEKEVEALKEDIEAQINKVAETLEREGIEF